MMEPVRPDGMAGQLRAARYDDPKVGARWHIMAGARLVAVCDDEEIASYLADCGNHRLKSDREKEDKEYKKYREFSQLFDLYSKGKMTEAEFKMRSGASSVFIESIEAINKLFNVQEDSMGGPA